jgi:translation elongation factor EF-G
MYGKGAVIGGLNARRGTIIDSEVREDEFTAVAEVALNDMFGYSNQLRGATQGKGEFSMEYKVWSTCPFFPLENRCLTLDVETHASVAECAG